MSRLPSWRRWVLRHLPAPIMREPALLFLAFLCVLSAFSQLVGADEPGSVSRLMPTWLIKAWNAELLIGGGLTLFGILRNRTAVAVLGLTPLGFAALAYTVAIVAVAGQRGALSAAITAAFACTCWVKAFVYSTANLSAGGR